MMFFAEQSNEVLINSLKNKMKRDSAVSQNEIVLRLLNNDIKHQKQIVKFMSEFEEKNTTLIYNVLNIFNVILLVNANNLEQETFLEILKQISVPKH
jgi:hypothetical protein